MGRLRAAWAAGRAAVAQATPTEALALAGPLALLVPGLSGAALDRALDAFRREAPWRPGHVLIADHLPAPLSGPATADAPGFEHLIPLADLLPVAGPAAAVAHLARRVEIILARRAVAVCLWTGAEAQVIVQAIAARTAARAQDPPPLSGELAATGGHMQPVAHRIFRPLAFRD